MGCGCRSAVHVSACVTYGALQQTAFALTVACLLSLTQCLTCALYCVQGCTVLHTWRPHAVLCGESQTQWLSTASTNAFVQRTKIHAALVLTSCLTPALVAAPILHCVAHSTNTSWRDNRPCLVFAAIWSMYLHQPPTTQHKCVTILSSHFQGLLAGRNDYELLQHGSIRDINRHYFR